MLPRTCGNPLDVHLRYRLVVPEAWSVCAVHLLVVRRISPTRKVSTMAVDSREIHSVEGPRLRLPGARMLLTAILALWAGHLMINSFLAYGQVALDDWRYGRPRTTHFSGFVGHNEAGGTQSRFIGLNLERQVVVLEFPGGDPSQVRVLPGPYLFGASEDLTPVDLALEDMDRDSYVDLIVTVRDEQIVYLNKDGKFRLPTADEQQKLRVYQPR
jgi:hypothetical protein